MFEPPLTDPRTDGQRAKDSRRVCRQVSTLGERQLDRSQRRHLIRLLQARRADNPDLTRIGVVKEPGGVEALIAWGELLVRAEDAELPRVRAVLDRYGLRPVPVECLQGRVVRAHNPDVGPQRLHRVARLLRGHGVTASVNHIAPLAPIGKALSGPEPTRVREDYSARTRPVADGAVVVAVVDTGITDQKRTDGWLAEVPRSDGNTDPLDVLPRPGDGFLDYGAGHGTFAAGVVAQVAPTADVRVYRALDSDGIGSDVEVACAILQAVQDGADVVNLSLGTQTIDDMPPVALAVALELVAEHERRSGRHVMLVAAAGNYGDNRPCWPASFRPVVSVAGLTADLAPAPWSSRGQWVDCSTVGEGVVSTYVEGRESPELDLQPDAYPTDPWAIWSGTSFAAPQVAGALARLRAEGSPSLRQALADLLAQGRPIPGYGRAVRVLPGT